ncbi:MAG: PAS domain-containing sensor histidine kinase [Sphingobacteriales bacterium]|nr:MAG: PAS domain-containing sensor histidine kinase [Sphingobacteriales bacterium]
MNLETTHIDDIIEAMQDGFLQIDENWNIIKVNQHQERLSGINRSESIGKNVWDVFPEATKLALYDFFNDALNNKIAKKFEEHHPKYDLWIEVSVSPTNTGGIIVIFRDITAKKNFDLKHLESEKNFIQLADSMPQIVWTADPDGLINYYNQRWYEYTGFEKNEGGDASWVDILHPEDLQYCKDTWYNAVKTGEAYSIKYRFKDRLNPGNYRWFLGKALPVIDACGNIKKWFGTCTDINELTISQDAFKISESQIRFLADVLPQQVWTAMPNGDLDYVNKRTIDFYGKNFNDIIGSGWQTNIHPDDLPLCLESWQHSLETGTPHQLEMRIKNAEEQYIWHLAKAEPYVVNNNVVKWFGTCTDIAIQKKNEQLKDDFISIASHELKSPLTPIKGYLQLLQKIIVSDSKASTYVIKSLENVYKLEVLVNDLDTSKINADNVIFNKAVFRFDFMLENCLENFAQENSTHKIKLKNCPPVVVTADALKIQQVLVNCISNAIKYSPNANEVVVDVNETETELIVNITDFGIGIAKENLDKLFDRFYRVEDTSMKFKGMGLGLYISSEIIKKHQGKFWVNSILHEGTTISFSLPL